MPIKAVEPVHLMPTTYIPYVYPANLYPIPKNKDIHIDIGPGRGDFLFHLAKSNPNAIALGIEIKRRRVNKIIKRFEKFEIKNGIIVQSDARKILPVLFPEPRVKEIYVSFPDPWPKKRHAKNRVLCPMLIEACEKALLPGGTLTITSDVKSYSEDTATYINKKILKPAFDDIIVENSSLVFPSFFAEKWKDMGRNSYIQRYIKLVPECISRGTIQN